jgi:AmmeMemoRadiSam system protein A
MSEPPARSPTATPTPAEGAALASIAASAIAHRLGLGDPSFLCHPAVPPALRVTGASFVTLESSGCLRGCIGSLEPVRPLYLDVARNAIRATTDPRMPPVTAGEWPMLDVHVSVLTTPEPLVADGQADLLALLRPGVDGLILADGVRRATFLPAVWGKLGDPVEFLAALLVKGGWSSGEWPDGITIARYTAVEFHDPAPRS